MSARTRAEVSLLMKKAEAHLRKGRELHSMLQSLMLRLEHEGLRERRKTRRKPPK
jgi:hypothetical protein